MLIGMRIIKTALAITLSVFVANLFNLSSPFFAAVAALITMQGNLVNSFSMAKYRILGTVMGAGLGFVGAYFAPGNPLIVGFGVGLIIFVNNKLHWNKAISIAAIVFASIMLGDDGSPTLLESLNRVVDTFAGIAVAVAVNFSISRPSSRRKFMESATDLVHKSKDIVGMLICQEKGYALGDISQEIESLERELPGISTEIKMHIVSADQDLDFDEIKELVDELYQNLTMLADMECSGRFNEGTVRKINKMYGVDFEPSQDLTELDIVYNYHLRICLDIIKRLTKMFKVEEDKAVTKPVNKRQAGQ